MIPNRPFMISPNAPPSAILPGRNADSPGVPRRKPESASVRARHRRLILVHLEGLLDTAILPGMEGQHGDATAGPQARGQLLEQPIQHTEFVVDLDAQGLEHESHALLAIFWPNFLF